MSAPVRVPPMFPKPAEDRRSLAIRTPKAPPEALARWYGAPPTPLLPQAPRVLPALF